MKLSISVSGERFRLAAQGDSGSQLGEINIIRIESGVTVGHARVEVEDETAHIAALVLDEQYRRYGAGSEAAALLVDALLAGGAKRVTAWAPPEIGLAAYFWYRMGLHALHGTGPGGGILYETPLSQTV